MEWVEKREEYGRGKKPVVRCDQRMKEVIKKVIGKAFLQSTVYKLKCTRACKQLNVIALSVLNSTN